MNVYLTLYSLKPCRPRYPLRPHPAQAPDGAPGPLGPPRPRPSDEAVSPWEPVPAVIALVSDTTRKTLELREKNKYIGGIHMR